MTSTPDGNGTPANSTPSAAPAVRPTDLVLEGGGVKGIGLVGAALALSDAGYSFQRVAGASAGAIVAALIAALDAAAKPISDLKSIIDTIDYQKFMNRSALGDVGLAERLLVHQGLYDGNYLTDWLGSQLQSIGITTFAQLRDTDPGLDSTLSPSQRYTLVVQTSDITRRKAVRLPWDYPCYGLEPDHQRIVDAVRASMSIPFFFEPVRFKAKSATVDGVDYEAGQVTWVDGGLLSNFPIEDFDRVDGVAPRWPTIGIKLSAREVVLPAARPKDDLIGEAISCLSAAINNADRYYLTPDKVARTIFVDSGGVSTTDFGLTPDQQRLLFANGQQAARAYCAAHPATQ